MTNTQSHIADYLAGGPPSQFTLRCFVGMLETGEAVHADFIAAAGIELANRVTFLRNSGYFTGDESSALKALTEKRDIPFIKGEWRSHRVGTEGAK